MEGDYMGDSFPQAGQEEISYNCNLCMSSLLHVAPGHIEQLTQGLQHS